MVMERLGPSLKELVSKNRSKKFSVKTVAMVAEQVVRILQAVHQCGIVYRDIKPHNFLLGLGERSKRLHVVDFGLSKPYIDGEGNHMPYAKKKRGGITGTALYSSQNVHAGYNASRRDDLEAAGYMFVHLLKGALPWTGFKSVSKRTRHKKVGLRKMAIADEDLLEGFPHEFVEYFQYCRSLKFKDEPDYDYLRELMKNVVVNCGCPLDGLFDWESGKRTTVGKDREPTDVLQSNREKVIAEPTDKKVNEEAMQSQLSEGGNRVQSFLQGKLIAALLICVLGCVKFRGYKKSMRGTQAPLMHL